MMGLDLLTLVALVGGFTLFRSRFSHEPLERLTGLPIEPFFLAFGLFLLMGALHLAVLLIAVREFVRRVDLRPGARAAWLTAFSNFPFLPGALYALLSRRRRGHGPPPGGPGAVRAPAPPTPGPTSG